MWRPETQPWDASTPWDGRPAPSLLTTWAQHEPLSRGFSNAVFSAEIPFACEICFET